MKSVVSQQKTPIWDSICTPEAPSQLIFSGHSPRLGGHNFRLGGTSSHLGGHGPGMPPGAPGLCGSNEKGEDVKKKKKAFSSKIFTNSGFHLKFFRFSTNPKVKTKKKRSSSPKFHEIRCESSKTTKKQFLLANSRAISTNL